MQACLGGAWILAPGDGVNSRVVDVSEQSILLTMHWTLVAYGLEKAFANGKWRRLE